MSDKVVMINYGSDNNVEEFESRTKKTPPPPPEGIKKAKRFGKPGTSPA